MMQKMPLALPGLIHCLRRRSTVTMKRRLPLAVVFAFVVVGGSLWLGCGGHSVETRTGLHAPADDTRSVPVKVIYPERHDLVRRRVLPGSLEPFEQVTLYAKTAGYLRWIKVDIGDRVRQGDVLAALDVPEMAEEVKQAEADLQRARAKLAHARAELDRARADARLKKVTYERLRSVRQEEPDVLSQQRVDEARAALDVAQAMVAVAESQIDVAESEVARAEANRARLMRLMEYARIRAPFNGVVTKRYVDPGALIQRALSQKDVSPIVTIARADRLRLTIDVAEPDVPYARPGRSVTFTVDALPDRVFKGTLTRVARALDPQTRTMRAEIDVANHRGLLHPGMYAHVTLVLERRKDALTVPAEALIIEGGRAYVYTVRDGRARRIAVERGLDDGIRVEIVDGLTERDPVIMSGRQAVRDGTPVTITHS